jgi:triosephosphate isomerase
MYNVVCVPSISQALKIARLKPRYIAYEVPSLIGTGKAISKAKPGDVSRFAKAMEKRGIIPLCGAGISNGDDVRTAIQLGCKGVLLASAVANAKNPRRILIDLVK